MESAHFRPHSIKSAHRHGSRSVQESAYTIETSTLPATFIVPLPRPTNSSCDRRMEKKNASLAKAHAQDHQADLVLGSLRRRTRSEKEHESEQGCASGRSQAEGTWGR